MSEPKRWLEQGASPDVERLIRAAQAEQPDAASLARSLAAVGVGVGATSVAPAAKAAATAAKLAGTTQVTLPVMGGVLAKGTALGLVVATLAAGASKLVSDPPHAAEAPLASTRVSERSASRPHPAAAPPSTQNTSAVASARPPSSTVASAPLMPRPAAPEPSPGRDMPLPAVSAAGQGSGVPPAADTLAQEVARIDAARAALAAGRAAETLAILDDYERRFPKRGFAPEALFLRMEACTSLGRAAEARAIAQRLLDRYPNSLHESRARAVLARNP